MFFTEFFTILIIFAAVFLGYKYRHLILKWLNTRPVYPVNTKRGVVKDLDVLMKYGIPDAIDKIVNNEREWTEAEATLGKKLREMNDEVREKTEKANPTKPETAV